MAEKPTVNVTRGMGCGGVLAISSTLLFVALKLLEHIEWAWIWVLMPIILYVGFWTAYTIVVLGIYFLGCLLVAIEKERMK